MCQRLGQNWLVSELLGLRQRCLEHLGRPGHLATLHECPPEADGCPDRTGAVAEVAIALHRRLGIALGVRPCGSGGGARCAVEQRRAVSRIRGDRECLLEVADRLVVGSQRAGSIGRTGERKARLAGDRIGLRAFVGGIASRKVVAGQRAGHLVVADALVVACDSQVPRAAVPARERAVRDLLDQRLDEPILAALRRARIGLDLEQLAANQGAQARLQVIGRAGDRGQRIGGEDLAKDGGVLEERAVGRLESVQPRGDERAERVRHGNVR